MSFRNDSARLRRRAARRLWAVNIGIAVGLGTTYLSYLPPRAAASTFIFAPAALVSTMALLSLWPGLLTQAVASLPWRRAGGVVQAVAWSFAQLLVFADTRIYELFRFHFNGMVWNLLTTPGAEDSLHLGARTWLTVFFAGVVLAALQYAALAYFTRRLERAGTPVAPARLLGRPGAIVALALLALVVGEKAVFAWSDIAGHRGIESVSGLFPGYMRLTVRRVFRGMLGAKIENTPSLAPEAGMLAYPKESVALPPGGPRPNVLMIVIDSLRADMLAPETMPRTSELALQSRRFDDHASSGNCTRYGTFGMLYGLVGSYWTPMLNERRPPVMLDALEAGGYDLHAFASATLASPELRSTCFAGLCRSGTTAKPGLAATIDTDEPGREHERIEDALLHDSPEGRDTLTGARAAQWLKDHAQKSPRRPFFAYVFLDAPHQVYSYPPEHEIFKPAATDVDYLALSGKLDAATSERLFNRYRNAVHYADAVTGVVLDALRDAGFGDDTIVIVTGDHGEEFGEAGFWGHTSNYTDWQVRVPFIMRGPGIEPGVETRPTSHLDVPATILEACGVPASLRASWTLGGNLLQPPTERRRVFSGWDRFAIWTRDGIIWLPLAGRLGSLEVMDHRWQQLPDDEQDRIIAANMDAISELAKDSRRFLR